MNERINELRLEAGISRIHEVPYIVAVNKAGEIEDPLIGLENFAKLLIKECITVAKNADDSEKVFAWYAIQKHFGVE